jgi:hypothetical protein
MYTSSTTIGHLKRYFSSPTYIGIIPSANVTCLSVTLTKPSSKTQDILLNGDTFCCMMGKYDPRRSKDGIRPEHNKANYLDAIVNDAIEWFSPYAHNIKVVGYGNHETAILKNLETDLIDRFVFGLNSKNDTKVEVGGYGGWIVYTFVEGGAKYRTELSTFTAAVAVVL